MTTEQSVPEPIMTRERVAEVPHSLAMGMYVGESHGIPSHARHSPDQSLFHYTDAAGLLGIISSHRMWATDIAFLNDPSEGRYLPQVMLSHFEKLATDQLERDFVAAIRVCLATHSSYNVHSISFCEDGDLLSQWRGYSSIGKGYAIEFRFNERPDPQLGILSPVTYGDNGLVDLSRDIFPLYISALRKYSYDEGEFAKMAAEYLSFLSPYFKDPAYAEEREFRIISIFNQDGRFAEEMPLKFRTRGSDIIPYVPLAWKFIKGEGIKALPIRSVVIGPGLDFDRNKKSVQAMLRQHGYADVTVVASRIPFNP